MTNHFHILLEVTPLPGAGTGGEVVGGVDLRLSEEELLRRLGGLYSRRVVAGVAAEIAKARAMMAGDWEGFERLSKVVRCRIRYFTDGVVIGSRKFVNDAFALNRKHFSGKRKDGAWRPKGPKGALKDLAGEIWSMRDLQVDVTLE